MNTVRYYFDEIKMGRFSGIKLHKGPISVRLSLELIRTEERGEMLALIKQNADTMVGPGTGSSVNHAAWFNLLEVRSLI